MAEDSKILDMDLDSSVCRVCLLSDSKGFSLQQKPGLNMEYTFLEMFNACTHLEALDFDDFPQFICQSCSNDLQIVFDFLCRAAASDQLLKDQHEVKKKAEYHYISDENSIAHVDHTIEDKPFDFENQFEIIVDQCNDDIPSPTFEPAQHELINPESIDSSSSQGFGKQFVEGELTFERVCVESIDNSLLESDTGIMASGLYTEEEQNESNPFEPEINSIRKTSRQTKNSAVLKGQTVECKSCGKILKQVSINHHLKRCQQEEKLYLCSSCPKSFAVRCDLKNHMRTHDKDRERRYICSECGKGFFEKQSLKVHITRHVGDKEYHCTICPKQFVTKKSLDAHKFTHNRKLGRFVCKHCDKRFTSKADLTVHERFHTGDYPFQCEFCDKSYAVKSHYNYHLAKHKGITYKCDQCDKEFINRGSLTAHKFKHSERMPHECSICKKGFTSPYKLNRHKSSHKPKEDDDHIK